MATTVLEGTWEELQKHSSLLRGRRLRISILDEEESQMRTGENSSGREPNERMLAAMRKAKATQKNMRPTDGSQTQKILRQWRDGGEVRQMSQNLPAPAVVPDANILIALRLK